MDIQHKTARLYLMTGSAAIIIGGMVSAFMAKHPSTLAMWTSAYLGLVMGVVQVVLGVIPDRPRIATEMRLTYWAYGLFNVGNIVIIISTVMKYAHDGGNVLVTIIGSSVLIIALFLLGWRIRRTSSSWRKIGSYCVIICIAISIPIGTILAQR